MGLLADMKNIMADMQVNKTWSFGSQRWFRAALTAGHAFTPCPHVLTRNPFPCLDLFPVPSKVTPGCGPAA